MKSHYTYIIYSKVGDCYYRGYSSYPLLRLKQHNAGESKFTSKYSDWRLVYVEQFETKYEALKREKVLKKYSKAQILELLRSLKNVVYLFI